MKISVGVALTYKNKILLVHPTNAPWYGSFSIPKGLKEPGEDYLDTAVRELKEEVGIELSPNKFIMGFHSSIKYRNKKGKKYKELYTFPYEIQTLEEVNMKNEVIRNQALQFEEVDWAGFMGCDEALKRIHWRQLELLNLINNER